MANEMKNSKSAVCFLIILFLQCGLCSYYATEKQGFHIDEIYSYELSDNNFVHYNENYINEWHNGNYFFDAVTVSADNRFDYVSVYENQVQDVHPPFFYFLLHTVCALFAGDFSKWFGIALNMIFFILTQYVLYRFSKDIFKDNKKAFVPVVLYGFSIGAASCVVFIRMYMILTFWVVLFTYINYLLWKNFESKGLCIGVFVSTFFGFLTQYYFVIYAFFISTIFFVGKIILKKYKYALVYALIMFGALITNVIYYPAALKHIFGGYRGEEAFSNFTTTGLFDNLGQSFSIIDQELFSNLAVILFAALLCCWIYKFYKLKIKSVFYNEKENTLCITKVLKKNNLKKICVEELICYSVVIAIVSYIAVIAKIAPYITDRYIFCVFPLIMLCLTFCIEKIISSNFAQKTDNKKYCFVVGALLIAVLSGHFTGTVNYLYKDYDDKIDVMNQYSNEAAIFISEKAWKINNDVLLLSNFENIYPTDISSYDNIVNEIEMVPFKEFFVFISNDYYNSEEIVQQIVGDSKLNNYKYLIQNGYCDIYVCN